MALRVQKSIKTKAKAKNKEKLSEKQTKSFLLIIRI